METNIRQQLLNLDNLFYAHIADSFSRTRQAPNPGWSRLLPILQSQPANILDLGCGNGRFLEWLHQQSIDCTYLGLDQDSTLLTHAQAHATSLHHFKQADILTDLTDLRLPVAPNYITAFGLTHHLPGATHRIQWFQDISRLLAPQGYLIYTHWQIHHDPRFHKATRSLDLPQHHIHITPHHLDPGDYFLTWQDKPIYRYVHIYDDAEIHQINQLLQHQGLTLVDTYLSDGRTNNLNQYWIWQKHSNS